MEPNPEGEPLAMTRRRWITLAAIAIAAAITLVGVLVDDGSDNRPLPPDFGRGSRPARSQADAEAERAAREQFERVFARSARRHSRWAAAAAGPRSGTRGHRFTGIPRCSLSSRSHNR